MMKLLDVLFHRVPWDGDRIRLYVDAAPGTHYRFLGECHLRIWQGYVSVLPFQYGPIRRDAPEWNEYRECWLYFYNPNDIPVEVIRARHSGVPEDPSGRLTMTMTDACWMRLANGWTVSLSLRDTPPALCSIAAWPTRQDDLAWSSDAFGEVDLFNFGDGRTDCRCWSYRDIREALKKVAAAAPPVI